MEGFFKFNKVDFGLFYSGIITDKKIERPFTMVYDCGAKNQSLLKPEIDAFKKDVVATAALTTKCFSSKETKQVSQKPPLNMLVFSHLHADHVNGITQVI